MQEERRLAVLRAIVEDYVATEEPVGSKALVERHGLGVSPATVRNDMAALEDEGYITQPHTSAGRVPTDKGYRLFVDRLTTVKPMSAAGEARDLDVPRRCGRPRRRRRPLGAGALPADPPGGDGPVPHALALHGPPHRAGRAGAQPAARRPHPQHRPGRAAGGRAGRRPDRRGPRRAPHPAQRRRGRRGDRRRRRGAAGRRTRRPTEQPPRRWSRCWSTRWSTSAPTSGSWSGGAANLARYGDSFDSAVRPLLEALEEHVVLLKLLGEASTGGAVTRHDRRRGPLRAAVGHQRHHHRLRPARRGRRDARHRRSDPHGLPRDDGRGARRRALRLPDPRRGLSAHPCPERNHEPARPVRPARREPRRGRRHHQEGLPQARPPAAPRRQPRPGGAGEVPGGRARLRDPRRPAEAGGLRPRRRPVRRDGRLRPGRRLLVHRHHGRVLRRPAGRTDARARGRAPGAARTR